MFNQKIITIILARGGSKGLYKKNLRLLNNEPLITRAIRHVKESGISSEILVSTDDEEISNIAKQSGAIVPFIRPEDLSGDLTTTEDSLKHALIEFEKLKKIKFDIGVFITVTDIFRDPIWIKEAVDILINNPKIESAFSGHKTHKNFWEKDKNGKWIRLRDWMATYSSRQIRTPIVREDTGLACASRAYLWREGRRIGDSIEIITNDDDFTSIDIHNLEDLLLAEAALKIRKKKSIS